MKKEKTALEKAFSLFLGTNSSKPVMQKIYKREGYTIASDGSVLIRTCNDDCDFEVEKTNLVGPKSKGVMPDVNRNDILTFEKDVFEKYKTEPELGYFGEDVICPICDGLGEVEWEYESFKDDFDCPVCDGTGFSEIREERETGRKTFGNQRVKLNDAYLKMSYFYKLIQVQELIGGDIELVSLNNSGDAVMFKIRACEIIIMPLIHHHSDEVEILDLTNQLKNN